MVVQGLLVVVERCLEGTEEVTNPNDVEYVVDDVHHSSDGDVHVYLVHDVLLSLDVWLLPDVCLDELLELDELHSPIPDDYLELLGQQDALFVLLILDDLVLLDDNAFVVLHYVALFLCHDVDVLDNGDGCLSPSC